MKNEIDLSLEIINLYRSWRNLDIKKSPLSHGFSILVDDLSNVETIKANLNSTQKIYDQFKNIKKALETDRSIFGRFNELTINKISQSLEYINPKNNLVETRDDLIARGSVLATITGDYLENLNQEYQTQLNISKESLNSKALFDEYHNQPYSGDSLINYMSKTISSWSKTIEPINDISFNFKFRIEEIDLDLPFINLVNYENGLRLLINKNMTYNMSRGRLDFLCLHEFFGHIVHLNHLENSIKTGEIPPHILGFNMHSYDSFYLEGIAQAMTLYLVENTDFGKYTESIKAENKLSILYMAVIHANILDIIDRKFSLKNAVERHVHYIGGEFETVKSSYQQRLANPFLTSQVMNYCSSFLAIESLTLLPLEQQKLKLENICSDVLSPSELRNEFS